MLHLVNPLINYVSYISCIISSFNLCVTLFKLAFEVTQISDFIGILLHLTIVYGSVHLFDFNLCSKDLTPKQGFHIIVGTCLFVVGMSGMSIGASEFTHNVGSPHLLWYRVPLYLTFAIGGIGFIWQTQ